MLLVESDVSVALTVRKWLESYGYCDLALSHRLAATMVEDALRMERPYQLICLCTDKGTDLLAQVKAMEAMHDQQQNARILLIHDRRMSILPTVKGVDRFICKPLDCRTLFEAVESLLASCV